MTNLAPRFPRLALAGVLGLAATALVGGNHAGAAEAPVGLGTAGSFAVLAGSTVTNTGPSIISGDLGVSPGTAVVGFDPVTGPGTVNNGTVHSDDGVARQAQSDLTIAYVDAAGRSQTAGAPADLVGRTFTSGVYGGPTLGLTGTMTLDAEGKPDAVFIFQAASTLTTASASRVSLINGANACNVYWQIGSSAVLGTNSVFAGTILALTSITANTGARVEGRLLARNGAVTLDTNRVTRGNCAFLAPGATTSSTTTSTTQPPASTSTTDPGATSSTTVATTSATSTTLSPLTVTTLPGTTGGTTASGGTTGAGPGSAIATGTGSRPRVTASTPASGAPTPGAPAGAPPGGADGGDGSTATAETPLAHTGSQLTLTGLAGFLSIILGAMMVRGGRTNAAAGQVRRYRC